jgi:Bacterial protein of unknown function (DUF882)
MDFYIPGVSLEKLRETGLRLQAGGVGFYPSSGSPFVHMDTGTIRHWPRMTYAALSRVFPDGKTVHVSADGRPLPHFADALAEVEAHGKAPNHVALEQARAHGAITEQQVQTAELNARSPQPRSLLASLFGGGNAQKQETTGSTSASRVRVASADAAQPLKPERAVPAPSPRPNAAPSAAEAPRARGLMAFASADMTGSSALLRKVFAFDGAKEMPIQGALAYAYAPSDDFALVRGQHWGVAAAQPQAEPPASVPQSQIRTEGQTSIVGKAGASEPMLSGAQRIDSPWLRAAMLTPSVSEEMTVTRFGELDARELRVLFAKPNGAVAMGFSEEPALGTERFTGSAVVFLSKATFVRTLTASLVPPTTR